MGAGGPAGAATITEQMSQIDQAITLTLQEIDENFAKSHQLITGRILPAVKRYGESSYRISHATRVS
jgi:DASH complex subunit ASK1